MQVRALLGYYRCFRVDHANQFLDRIRTLASAAFSCGVSLISIIFLNSLPPSLDRHSDVQALNPILALKVCRTRQNLLLVFENCFHHFRHSGGRSIVSAAGL